MFKGEIICLDDGFFSFILFFFACCLEKRDLFFTVGSLIFRSFGENSFNYFSTFSNRGRGEKRKENLIPEMNAILKNNYVEGVISGLLKERKKRKFHFTKK